MKVHLKYLDGLRAVAALFVVVHHIFVHLPGPLFAQLLASKKGQMLGWLLYGHFAVDLFIMLSGFCLMLPVVSGDGTLKGGASVFYFKRARRILPPYYFAVGFSLLLIHFFIGQHTGTHWDCSIPVTRTGIILHLLLLHDIFSWLGGLMINHAFWSIPVEVHIYLFFPLLVWCANRFGLLRTCITALAISAVATQILLTSKYGAVEAPFYGLFVMGAIAAAISYRRSAVLGELRTRFPWWFAFGAVALVLGFYCYRSGFDAVTANFNYVDYIAGLAGLFLLVALALSHKETNGTLSPVGATKILSSRFLVFVGSFAYSLYLIHAPLIQIVWQYVLPKGHKGFGSFCLLTILGVPLILVASYLFFLCFERPFLSNFAKKSVQRAENALHEAPSASV